MIKLCSYNWDSNRDSLFLVGEQQQTRIRALKITSTQTVLCESTGWVDGSLGPEAPLNFRCHHKLCLYTYILSSLKGFL